MALSLIWELIWLHHIGEVTNELSLCCLSIRRRWEFLQYQKPPVILNWSLSHYHSHILTPKCSAFQIWCVSESFRGSW